MNHNQLAALLARLTTQQETINKQVEATRLLLNTLFPAETQVQVATKPRRIKHTPKEYSVTEVVKAHIASFLPGRQFTAHEVHNTLRGAYPGLVRSSVATIVARMQQQGLIVITVPGRAGQPTLYTKAHHETPPTS